MGDDLPVGYFVCNGVIGIVNYSATTNLLETAGKQVEVVLELQAKVDRLERDRNESENSEKLMKTIFQNASDAVKLWTKKVLSFNGTRWPKPFSDGKARR